jgi:hypothetical protein
MLSEPEKSRGELSSVPIQSYEAFTPWEQILLHADHDNDVMNDLDLAFFLPF